MVLVGYWPLTENSGTAYDYSGNGHHGTVNGATQGVTGLMETTAYDFDGTDDNVVIDSIWDEFPSNDTPFTLSAWANFDNNNGNRVLTLGDHDSADTGNVSGFRIGNAGGGNDIFAQITNSGNRTTIRDNVTTPTDTWIHIAATYDGTNFKLFVDGVLEDSTTSGSWDTDTVAKIGDDGSNESSNIMDGTIAEARVYNHALTEAEIQYLYEVTKNGSFTSRKKA